MRTATRSLASSLVVLLVSFGTSAAAQPRSAPAAVRPPVNAVPAVDAPATLTPEAVVSRQEALFARLGPEAKKQLEAAARDYRARLERSAGASARTATKGPQDHARDAAASLRGGALGGDIEALALVVMAQAARDAEADLRSLLVELKETQRTKEDLRRFLEYRKLKRAGGKPAVPTGLDSMSELGEMESLRLQMAMDRLSKMMSTLSNMLKRISDTQNAITQNLK